MLSDLEDLPLWKAADHPLISFEVRSPVRGLPPLDVVLSRRQPTTRYEWNAIGDEKDRIVPSRI